MRVNICSVSTSVDHHFPTILEHIFCSPPARLENLTSCFFLTGSFSGSLEAIASYVFHPSHPHPTPHIFTPTLASRAHERTRPAFDISVGLSRDLANTHTGRGLFVS